MLLWEPKSRGQKTPNQLAGDRQRPYCFEFLDQILATKVSCLSSQMFLLHLNWLLSYQCANFVTTNSLQVVMFMNEQPWLKTFLLLCVCVFVCTYALRVSGNHTFLAVYCIWMLWKLCLSVTLHILTVLHFLLISVFIVLFVIKLRRPCSDFGHVLAPHILLYYCYYYYFL